MEKNDDDVMENLIVHTMDFLWWNFLMDFFDSAKMDFLWWIFLMENLIVQKWISFDGFFWWNFLIVHTMVHMMVNNDDTMMENNDVMNDGEIWW